MATKQYAAKVTIGGALKSSFKSAFGGASDAIGKLGKEVRALARQRADIKAFGESSIKVDDLKRSLADAKVKAEAARKALADAEKPTAALSRAADVAEGKVKRLERSLESEVGTLGRLTLKLNQAGMKTSDLERQDARLEARIESMTAAMRRHEAASNRFGKARAKLGNWLGAGVAVGVAMSSFIPAINAAGEFSDAMVDVGKFVDDANTPAKLAEIGGVIRDIGRDSPLGAKGMASLVADAGKIGMLSKDALEFAKATGVMAIGLEMTADEAGETISKIKTGMGTSIKETLELGDAINYLADKTAASSRGIADIVMRQGGTVKATTKLTTEQIAALASAFEPVSPNAETAATAMKNFTKALTIGAAASDAQEAAFGKIGMTAKGVAEAMQKDGVGTIMKVLEAVKKVPDAERGGVLTKLFGDESKGPIAQLLNNTKQVADSFQLVADKQNYLGRSQAEYERELGKFSNQWLLTKNRIADVGITIGEALLPVVRSLFGAIGKVAKAVSLWAKENPKLFRGIVIGPAVVAGLAAAIVGVGLAFSAISVAASGFAALYSAVGVVAAAAGMSVGALVGIFAGVGVAVAAVVLAIRKYWEPIGAFFQGVWAGIKEGWESAGGIELWNQIKEVLGFVGQKFMELVEPVKLTSEEFEDCFGHGKTLGEWIGTTLAGLLRMIIDPATAFRDIWQEIREVFVSAFDTMRAKAEPFFEWITSKFDWVGKQLHAVKGWFGGGGGGDNPAPAKGVSPETSFNPPPMKGATSQVNHIQIHTQPGQSEEAIANHVIRRMRELNDQQDRGALFDAAYA